MKFFRCLAKVRNVLRQFLLCAVAFVSMRHAAIAYDNSEFPPFEASKVGRGINWISIHPDGERWLISECMDLEDSKRFRCDLFLYNLKTKAYQKYDLPAGYLYSHAKFSPHGGLIVAVRRPVYRDFAYDEQINSFKHSEIFTMRPDGTGIRLMPNLSGHMKLPSMSEDEKKSSIGNQRQFVPREIKRLLTISISTNTTSRQKKKKFSPGLTSFSKRGAWNIWIRIESSRLLMDHCNMRPVWGNTESNSIRAISIFSKEGKSIFRRHSTRNSKIRLISPEIKWEKCFCWQPIRTMAVPFSD